MRYDVSCYKITKKNTLTIDFHSLKSEQEKQNSVFGKKLLCMYDHNFSNISLFDS